MSNQQDFRLKVKQALGNIKSYNDIYDLFRLLEFPEDIIFKSPTKRKIDEFDFPKDIKDHVREIYSLLSFGTDLPVFLIESDLDTSPFIRDLTKKLSERYIRFLLVLTDDYSKVIFVYPEIEKIEAGKHRLKITKLPIETGTDNQYWSDIETICGLQFSGGKKSYRDVWLMWRESFKVQKITEIFFDDYKDQFFKLREDVLAQGISVKEAHEFTLQFLNRLMFIHFISRKGWLNNNPKFLRWYWNEYRSLVRKTESDGNKFYSDWLASLFFKALNGKGHQIDNLPKDIKDILSAFPNLNGGLFLPSATDELGIKINDSQFENVYMFFERYHFTIKEDMPLDSEVAVDPQMIGYVYESLANVAETIYDRKDMGIFYTPRVEVEFMCRRSLVEYLSNHQPDIPKEEIYRFVFDEKEQAAKYFDENSLWRKLEDTLDNISVVDPACGSGAFLVGMLNVLVELYREIYKHIEKPYAVRELEFDFELKKRIIHRSLYGVDVMPWAVHAAELRLWLQMIIHSDFPNKDLIDSNPLLPNLDLNLRRGDSLVQKIGGKILHLRRLKFSKKIHRKLEALKIEKQDYFRGRPDKYKTADEFKAVEAEIFDDIIQEQRENLKEDKIKKNKTLKQLCSEQTDLLDSNKNGLFKKEIEKLEEQIKEIDSSISDLNRISAGLDKSGQREFVWEIDFAEIFGDKGGFDIVIGNPPYVRHENISPPNIPKALVNSKAKNVYKNSLLDSIISLIPVNIIISKKSDYFIYFFYCGLALTNDSGTLSFVTSNSWLDAGYGKDFQEYLLKYVKIIGIIDNKKRSFEHADINTIITFLSSPSYGGAKDTLETKVSDKRQWVNLTNIAVFIQFNIPYEYVNRYSVLIHTDYVNLENIRYNGKLYELTENIIFNKLYKLFPIRQDDLLEDGWEYKDEVESAERFLNGKYVGNKWGGKLLRAPNIFYKILSKGARHFDSIQKHFIVETYLNTGGADKFFIVEREKESEKLVIINNTKYSESFKIESKYLAPFIKSPQSIESILFSKKNAKNTFLVRVFPVRTFWTD